MNDGATGGGSLAVGLVIGGGTGPEIATVFQRALEHLSRAHQVGVDIVACPHRFGTFFSAGGSESALEIHRGRERDCTLYQEFVGKLTECRVHTGGRCPTLLILSSTPTGYTRFRQRTETGR